jgi:hypothetical protein
MSSSHLRCAFENSADFACGDSLLQLVVNWFRLKAPFILALAPSSAQELEAAARALGVKIVSSDASRPDEIESALEVLASRRVDVVIVLQTSMLIGNKQQIAESALAKRLPTVYGYRDHVIAGGLVSYGVDLRWCFHRASQRREQVQDEWVHVRPKLCYQERHAVRHEAGDEVNVAAQAVEFRHASAVAAARFCERSGELWA